MFPGRLKTRTFRRLAVSALGTALLGIVIWSIQRGSFEQPHADQPLTRVAAPDKPLALVEAASSPGASALSPAHETAHSSRPIGAKNTAATVIGGGNSQRSANQTPANTAAAVNLSPPQSPASDEAENFFPRHWRRCFREYSGERDGYEFASDSTSAWSGSWSARISSRVERPSPYGAALCQTIAATTFRGQRVRVTLHMRALNAIPGAHLVFRTEGSDGRLLAFHNMEPRWVSGTADWSAQTVVIDVPNNVSVIVFGGALVNTGTLWIDDASIEVVSLEVPLSQKAAPLTHYNLVVDTAGLAQVLQNPGFEETMPVNPDK